MQCLRINTKLCMVLSVEIFNNIQQTTPFQLLSMGTEGCRKVYTSPAQIESQKHKLRVNVVYTSVVSRVTLISLKKKTPIGELIIQVV